jgi:hypothetical protein
LCAKLKEYFEGLNTQFQIDRNQLMQNNDELNQIHVYANKNAVTFKFLNNFLQKVLKLIILKNSNGIIKCYENQLHYLWKRSINSESFVIQLVDILKELKGNEVKS